MIEKILEALDARGKQYKSTGHSSYIAQCPAHPDSRPSLAITDDDSEKLLLHCFAGCDLNAILQALELEMSDLFAEKKKTGEYAEYRYIGLDGRELLKTRSPGKVFRWYTIEADGSRTSGRSATPLPYGSASVGAIETTNSLYIVEGEKDVDRAQLDGLVAISIPDGAGSWREEHTQWLKDALSSHTQSPVEIIIVADNDPPGLKHARQLASVLLSALPESLSVEVTTMVMANGYKDYSDWRSANPDSPLQLEPLPAEEQDGGDDGWDEVLPLSPTIPQANFDISILPPYAREFVTAVSNDVQIPIEFTGPLFLSAIAAAAVGQVEFHCPWPEQAGLYIACAMPSGTGKSPAFRMIISDWLAEFEAELLEETRPEREQNEIKRKILEGKLKKLTDQAIKESNQYEMDIISGELSETQQALHDLAKVPVPRLWVDDVTPEALGRSLAMAGGHLTLASTEGGPFQMMSGGYSDKGPNLDLYLKAYSGERYAADRIGRDTLVIPSPALNVVLAIQPQVIKNIAARGELQERGLIPRFLFAAPPSNVGSREISPQFVPPSLRRAYGDRMLRIARNLRSADGTKRVIFGSSGALSVLGDWRNTLETRRGISGDLVGMVEWTQKLESSTIRIAGLLALAWSDGTATTIEAEDMARAISLAEFWIAEAKQVYDWWQDKGDLGDAIDVWNRIQREGMKEVRRRDIQRWWPRRFQRAYHVDGILDILVERGYLRVREVASGRKGGQPHVVYDVRSKDLPEVLSTSLLTVVDSIDRTPHSVTQPQQLRGTPVDRTPSVDRTQPPLTREKDVKEVLSTPPKHKNRISTTTTTLEGSMGGTESVDRTPLEGINWSDLIEE